MMRHAGHLTGTVKVTLNRTGSSQRNETLPVLDRRGGAGVAGRHRQTTQDHRGDQLGLYTLPDKRGRGYAGSVTAAAAECAFTEGKTVVCLYTDLTNPFSNRCYAKMGSSPTATLGTSCARPQASSSNCVSR
jgi:RimJ/RimL family protein N-acetyltransferase